MAILAPITTRASANVHSWLHRFVAHFLTPAAPAPIACPINATIVELRLLLRRVDHARRDHARWDRRFLSQTVGRVVLAPLQQLVLADEPDRLRHAASFVLAPIAATGFAHSDTDPVSALEDTVLLLREAITAVENSRGR